MTKQHLVYQVRQIVQLHLLHQSVGKLSNSAADRTNGGATPIRQVLV